MRNFRKNNGITLIALVITIVVLLILATVSITAVFGDNGILELAKEAGEKTNEAVQNDYEQIEDLKGIIATYSITSDGSYSEKKKVNTPKLGSGMIPITWQAENEDGTQGKWVVPKNEDEWYDYQNKKWANAKTADGSMWVWIPRYAYSIAEENYHTNVAGTIQIDFMKGTSNESVSGKTTWDNASGAGNWNIHPAFDYNGTVPGIWVAKFEASHTNCTTDIDTGITNTNRTDLTLQVKPNITSWRNISVENAYIVCLNYNTALNSHLMKNMEWGAVTYLSQSIYGKNDEISLNQCYNYITGAGPVMEGQGEENKVVDGDTVYGVGYEYNKSNFDVTYSYKTVRGQMASTTGNIYGIYDMCGGSSEIVSAYIDVEYFKENEHKLANDVTYRKDVYVSRDRTDRDAIYEDTKIKYGDAIYETSNAGNYSAEGTWFSKYACVPWGSFPFMLRGGPFFDTSWSSIFFINGTRDYEENKNIYIGFRPVLINI